MLHLPIARRCLILISLLSLLACNKKPGTAEGPVRPSQPWAFRSVLDEQSRMLTLALHDNLWVAYHTDSCALYKAWKGHVHLQGAVYDNAHGPQPISIGNAWIVNPHKHPWSVKNNGNEMLKEVRYAGHAFKKGRVQLMYDLLLNDGKIIRVNEQPEYVEKGDQKGFERAFTLHDLPEGYEVSIAQQVSSIAVPANIVTNGKWDIEKQEKQDVDGRQLMTIDGRLTLATKGDTYFTAYFIGSPTIPNENKVEGEEESLPLGQKLIAQNDCKTCHNEKSTDYRPSV